jgi:hypothetical protein
MTQQEITDELLNIAASTDFMGGLYDLTDRLAAESGDIETVEPILRFMEGNPSLDFGVPGPLVHYLEGFYGNGYEERLIESIKRQPTSHTVWMLNRIINGTEESAGKRHLMQTMAEAEKHRLADPNTSQQIAAFLSQLS